MTPHYIETTLDKDGCLILEDLPFAAGDAVEVIILARQPASNGGGKLSSSRRADQIHRPFGACGR